ncbi:MAG TPA: hypothetical protein DCZ76_03610 [Treponema sp.]|nr:hypothetical protein [Treponema sp.]
MAPSGFCPEKRLPRYPFGHAERTCYDVCAEFFSVQKIASANFSAALRKLEIGPSIKTKLVKK